MNKIIIAALASAKPTVEQLLEIINATGNVEVATEVILGVYEQPAIEPECKRVSESEVSIEFISFDKFTNTVTFSYNRVNTMKRFIPNNKPVSVENAIGSYTWSEDAAEALNMSLEEFDKTHTMHTFKSAPSTERFHSSMPLSVWNGETKR